VYVVEGVDGGSFVNVDSVALDPLLVTNNDVAAGFASSAARPTGLKLDEPVYVEPVGCVKYGLVVDVCSKEKIL